MDFLPAFPRAVLAFVVVLGVLVFIHELGHYLAARWRKVHVEAFAIGFGKPLVKWTDKLGTEWRIGWLPLGGYVKLHGQEGPDDATEEQKAAWIQGRTFHEKRVKDRAIVVAAGPFANFLLAAVFFAGLFMAVGQPVSNTQIGRVVEDSAAARAGMQVGDRIVALDGQPVTRFTEIQQYIQPRAGQPVTVKLKRDGRDLDVVATPVAAAGSTNGLLGVSGGMTYEKLNPFSAVVAGVSYTGDIAWQTLAGVWQMISGQRGTEELGGPLRIAEMSGQVAEMGIASLITFMAILSVNLGLINLFPIPVLDGGHLVFYALEAIRGRPLPPRAVEYGFRIGFALLVSLFLFSTWNDIAHGAVGRWVMGLVS
ncbi:RIP metalloprotease RseP [Acetobacteraceae bacterium H6797]|nr:RIP metalloprotease RseP [Acetobacteraceae bacterium H6797]